MSSQFTTKYGRYRCQFAEICLGKYFEGWLIHPSAKSLDNKIELAQIAVFKFGYGEKN